MQKLSLIWKVPELRRKVLFILGMLAIFRIAAAVPVAGIDPDKLSQFFSQNQFFGLLNIFSGGTLENLSLVMLGVAPYITATIILQLLTMIFPPLKQMYYEEGEQGRQKFNQYGRMLTVPLAALQGFGFMRLLQSQQVLPHLGAIELVGDIAVVTAGTIFLMWLGELISEQKLGNGVSLIIFSGIVAGVLPALFRTVQTWDSTQLPNLVAFSVVSLVVIALVVLINEAQRKVPVAYAKRVRGMKMYGGVSTHLPVRVNSAGVIPIIFALSVLLFPGMVASFLTQISVPSLANIASHIQNFSSGNSWSYIFFYFVLVFGFTYFYTAIVFDAKEVSKNIQRAGGFIPGIRPGEPTAHFLGRVINRTTLVGAIFLGAIAVLPQVIHQTLGLATLRIGGTAVLIVVSVVLETMRQADAQLTMREYEGV